MIEEGRRPNPRSRGERTRRRERFLIGKDYHSTISPISLSPTKNLIHLENQRNNNLITKAGSLPAKQTKRRPSLTRLLSFGKKKKKSIGEDSKLDDFEASRETLNEEVVDFSATPPSSQLLRNPGLRTSSVIKLEEEPKKAAVDIAEDDSTDSFKSVDSPVLCNQRPQPVVDTSIVSWGEQGNLNPALTEKSFSAFENSDFLDELHSTNKGKRSVWKKLFRRDVVSVEYKPVTAVVDGGKMSQNQGATRKDKTRGRGGTLRRSATTSSEELSSPATPPPPKASSPVPKPSSPQPVLPDEETLKLSAAVGTQILQQKKEEIKRVSGDDLRKQLTEGLKNGSGRVKEVAKTDDVPPPGDSKSFIDGEKGVSDEKKDSAAAAAAAAEKTELKSDSKENSGAEKAQDEPQPSTSKLDNVPVADKLQMPPPEGKREHLYKILVIGELGTGKTSIIKRYVHQFFSQHYRATIGVDFALKVLNWDENTIIRLQLWDIAGQERFGNMTRVYYKEAVGAFIVFDVTRAATFDAVLKWKQDLDSKVQLSDGSPIPCVLLANKCDQPKEGIVNNKGKMDEFCREKGFTGWFETSAKENINIEDAARSLVLNILQNDKLVRSDRSPDGTKIALDGRADSTPSKSCSC